MKSSDWRHYRRHLIVNADDFGLSPAINRGIIAAHRNGIVTSASLMVNGPAFENAVALAQENPALDIGLHLTLTELGPVAAPDKVPSLVDQSRRFAPHAPFGLGLRLSAREARELTWQKPWRKVLQWKPPFAKSSAV